MTLLYRTVLLLTVAGLVAYAQLANTEATSPMATAEAPTTSSGALIPMPDPITEPTAVNQQWTALIKAAQKEGQLNVVLAGTAALAYQPVIALFSKEFGIYTVVSTGIGHEIGPKIVAAQKAGSFETDVIMAGAGGTFTSVLMPNHALAPVKPLLLPDVVQPTHWRQGHVWWGDSQNEYALLFAGSAQPGPMVVYYNKDLVTPQELATIKSPANILNPQWKGKIIASSPDGSGGPYVGAYLHRSMGDGWLTKFILDMDVRFSTNRQTIANDLANGSAALGVLLGGASRQADLLAEKGSPIGSKYDIAGQGEINVGGGEDALTVARNYPHPNATKLFINWWLSTEGQTAVQEKAAIAPDESFRTDVPFDRVKPERRIQPGADYLFWSAVPLLRAQAPTALAFVKKLYTTKSPLTPLG